jgi:uncharacterized membrane protein
MGLTVRSTPDCRVVGWECTSSSKERLSLGWIHKRIDESPIFQTTDLEAARKFLDKYGVQYIIGSANAEIPGSGIGKSF